MSLFKSLKQKNKKQNSKTISNDENSLSIEEMENKALFYLKKIAEIRTDKKFSSLASEFSNLIKKMGKNSS